MNDNLGDWRQQRIQGLQEKMLNIVKLLNDSENNLLYESNPQSKGKLEKDIESFKKQLKICEEELTVLETQKSWEKNIAPRVPDVTFEDLDFVITALLNLQEPYQNATEDFSLTDPARKMYKNELTSNVRIMLTSGLGSAKDVNYFIQNIATRMFPNVPEKLIATLKREYSRLIVLGVKGDNLFMKMYDFVSDISLDPKRKQAGLAVLCYFFQTCDVFEP